MSRHNKARRSALAELRAIYACIPPLECQGLCQQSCGEITMTELERDRIRQALGHELPPMPGVPSVLNPSGACHECPLLSFDGRCTVYSVRPLLCRLWGAVDDPLMRCPWGCRPQRYLTNTETRRLIQRLEDVDERLYGREE